MATGTLTDQVDTASAKPTRAEKGLLDHVEDLWEEGRVHRERWVPQKQRDLNRKLYRGEVGPKGGKECRYKLNFTQAFTDRQIAQLTQARPILRIEPRKAALHPIGRVYTKLTQMVWDDCDMQPQTRLVATNAALDGCAAMLSLYNPETQDILLKLCKVGDFVVDPAVTNAARVCTDAEYIGWRDIWTLDRIKQAFPARGLLVNGDTTLDDLSSKRDTQTGASGPVARWIRRENERSSGALQRAEVKTLFVRDRQRFPNGVAKFPTGRMVMWADGVILRDDPNIYWDGEWPMDVFEWLPDDEHVFGHSAMELLREAQLAFNAIMNGTVETRILTNFLSIIADWNALDTKGWNAMKSLDGANIFKMMSRGARFEIQPPPTVASDSLTLAKQIFTYAQIITGVTDVTLGENPGSLQSGAAIEGLQDSASLMTMARQSRMEDFYARIGQKLISRETQFLSSDRVLALIGQEKNTKNQSAEGGDLPDGVLYAKYRGQFFADEQGRGVSTEQRMRALRDFKFGVVPGSSGPNARQKRALLAGQLYQGGLLPGYMVLEMSDFPNARELAKEGQDEMAARAPLMQATKGL